MRQRIFKSTDSKPVSPSRPSPNSKISATARFLKRMIFPRNGRTSKDDNDSPQLNLRLYQFGWFYIYCIIIFYGLAECFWAAIVLSTPSGNSSFNRIQRYLSPGWIPIGTGYMDNSDAQYKGFRNNIPQLVGAALAYFAIGYALRRFARGRSTNQKVPPSLIRNSTGPVTRSQSRSPSPLRDYVQSSTPQSPLVCSEAPIRALQNALFVFILHGNSAVIMLIMALVSYAIGAVLKGSRWNPVLTWIFNFALLFLVEPLGKFKFARVHPILLIFDGWRGVIPDWQGYWRMSTLRLISFNLDRYWQATATGHGALDERKEEWSLDRQMSSKLRKARTQSCHPAADYSLLNFFSYVYYVPLYLAGPIITFNDYLWQCKSPVVTFTRKNARMVGLYALRLAAEFLLYEVVLHLIFVVAIGKVRIWDKCSPIQIVAIGYVNLNCIWLKLLIIWRFFRTWAFFDGIDSPENMTRCMTMHFSAVDFWRHWHVSFNLWLVRYIYIPLGGSRVSSIPLRLFNVLLVFSFVAIWHDLSRNVLTWGWLITLFICPEVLAVYLFEKKYLWSKNPMLWRNLAAFGAAGNIILMCTANLIGYAVGVEGMLSLYHQLFNMRGFYFMVKLLLTVFCLAQVQLEIKHYSLRKSRAVN